MEVQLSPVNLFCCLRRTYSFKDDFGWGLIKVTSKFNHVNQINSLSQHFTASLTQEVSNESWLLLFGKSKLLGKQSAAFGLDYLTNWILEKYYQRDWVSIWRGAIYAIATWNLEITSLSLSHSSLKFGMLSFFQVMSQPLD